MNKIISDHRVAPCTHGTIKLDPSRNRQHAKLTLHRASPGLPTMVADILLTLDLQIDFRVTIQRNRRRRINDIPAKLALSVIAIEVDQAEGKLFIFCTHVGRRQSGP